MYVITFWNKSKLVFLLSRFLCIVQHQYLINYETAVPFIKLGLMAQKSRQFMLVGFMYLYRMYLKRNNSKYAIYLFI